MTVDELIERLSRIKDKSQMVIYFDVKANVKDCAFEEFNCVRETREDGERLVVLKWED